MNKRPAVFDWSGARIPTNDFDRGTIIDVQAKDGKVFKLIVVGKNSRWLLVLGIDKRKNPLGVAELISPDKQKFGEIYVGDSLLLVFFENHRVEYLHQVASVKIYQDDLIASPSILELADDLVPMVVNLKSLSKEMRQRIGELKRSRREVLP